MQNSIKKSTVLKHSINQVWNAISDSKQFGEWFGVKFNQEFKAKQSIKGNITHPEYEHLIMQISIQELNPCQLFSFTWHPYAVDEKYDYSQEAPTLIEFKLQEIGQNTELVITESGFDNIPANRKEEAYKMNEGGWEQQIVNITEYLAKK